MGIPNACLWLKADDGAGTPGSSVGTWQDRSRNGKNLTGDSAPPTLVAGSATEGMNFNPVVRFDGNGQTMTRNESTIGTDASEINVFFVSRENKRQDSSVFSHSNLDNLRLHAHWPWITGDLYWDKGACCTTAANRNHSTAPFAMGVASLGLVTNSVVARTAEIIANAKKLDDVEPESPGLPITGNFLDTTRVGSMRTKSDNAEQPPYWYNGDIAELLEFKRNLDATQRTRVQSYLALKYGLTLDRDGLDRGELKDKAYTDGNDRAVYSYSGYWNSIIGIGRDRVTGLNQSVSRSTQKIGTGTDFKLVKGDSPLTIATAKSDGTADFSLTNHHRDRSPPSDGQYLVLGDNDGALTFDPATKRLHRVWRAQNTGGVGPVYLGFDADKLDAIFPTGKPGSLLVSTDANFGVGNTTLYPLGRVLISGKYVFTPVTDASSTTPMSTTRVTIPNGAYITLGQHCTGTALGIADACLWLKADDGADTAGTASATVSTWRDRSGNDKDMTGVGNPSVVAGSDTEGMNFNPVVRFNGSNQSVFRNESTIGTNASEINVFFVSRENARQYSNLFSHSTRDRVHLLTHWPWSDGNLYWDTGDIYDSTGNCCVADHRHYTAAPFKKKVANLGLVTNSVRANTMEIVVNAKKLPDRLPSSPVESPGVSLVDDSLNITSLSQGPNWYNGDIPEFLEFRRDLDATQRTRVQSYLALKYGLTLDRNGLKNKAYTSGNDASVYSYSDYWNSIIGIGRDSVTGLDQRVSRSTQKIGTADPFQLVEGDSPLTIATPKNDNSPDFTSANGGSRPELQPGQYLVLGDNNGDVATLGAATAEQFGRRIGRVWRAQNTGGVGAVYLGFDPTLLETNFPQDKRGFLLVSTDADFSVANTTRYALGRVTVGSKTVFTPVTDIGSATPVPVTIPNGSYITLGQESVCTGTVMGIADACLWLKANDDGLTPGGTVSTWPDRSGSQKNLTGENSPSVVAGSNTAGMNFNPVVRFNGSNQSVVRNESTIGTDVSEINIFFVNRETARKNSILLSHSNDGAPQRLLLHWPWGNGILAWDRGPCCVDPRPSSRAMSTAPFPEGVSNLGLVTNSVDTSIVENVVNARTLPKLEESKPGVRITGTFLDTTRIANGDYPLKTGGGGQFAANPYKGDFPELLEFKRHLNPTERTRVQSYLALKYGLTLDRDGLAGNAYTSGSGTSVYSDSNYWNSIIGIGRDSVTKLDQRVSRSTQKIGPERGADGLPTFQLVKGDSPLTIATSADFTSANGNHRPAENLPLEQYLVLGDNNGALNTLSASAMGSSLNRVPRVWRARNTGVSAVFLGLEKEKVSLTNTGRRYLFVESGANADGSFPPSRTRTYVLSNTLTDLTGYWVPVANGAAVAVNIPDGAYLSYGVRLGPAVTLTVQSRGGTGTFGFSGNRGFVASSATTTTEMQPRSTPEQWLPDDNGDLVISVAMPSAAGWRLEAASCIDRQAAASGNPGGAVLGGVSAGNQFTIPAAQAKASADLHCALVAPLRLRLHLEDRQRTGVCR